MLVLSWKAKAKALRLPYIGRKVPIKELLYGYMEPLGKLFIPSFVCLGPRSEKVGFWLCGNFRKLGVPYFGGPYNEDPTI